MSFEAARILITSHFQATWNPAHLPIVYENQQEPSTTAAWGRFAILNGDTNPMTIGNQGFNRSVGIVVLQMFVPENGGVKTFSINTDRLAAIFNLRTLRSTAVVCHFGCVGMASASATDGWLQRHARVTFRADTGA
jgi:hypothetical protein